MIRRYLRVALSALALTLATAGSMSLNRAGAQAQPVAPGGGGLCEICNCISGPLICCTWNGVTCYMADDR